MFAVLYWIVNKRDREILSLPILDSIAKLDIPRQLNDRSCAKDKHCDLVYVKAQKNDPCEPCPTDLSSKDYICANYKAILDFHKNIGYGFENGGIECEACGLIKYKNTYCQCNNNTCEKIIKK